MTMEDKWFGVRGYKRATFCKIIFFPELCKHCIIHPFKINNATNHYYKCVPQKNLTVQLI